MYKQALMRGDPGFLSSAFKGITGAISGGVRSLVTGGNPIAGAIAGGAAGIRAGSAPAAPQFSISPGTAMVPRVNTGMTPTAGQQMLPGGGAWGVSPLGTLGITTGRGYHPNRSTYWTSRGKVQKGSILVKNRHANYGNGRALKRALVRAHGFQHLARAVMSFTLTGKKYSRPHFKAARKGK